MALSRLLATCAMVGGAMVGSAIFAQPSAAEDITLEFVVWNYSLDTIQDNVKKFEAANPGIKVKITDYTWPDYQDSLRAALPRRHADGCRLCRPGLAAGLGGRRLLRAARRHRAGRRARRPQERTWRPSR